MKILAVLADAARPGGNGNISLLNAGWTFTTAIPVPDEGYTLPSQSLVVFVEAPWDKLNRPLRMVIELVDDEGVPAELAVQPEGRKPARIEQELNIASVPGAPNGTPGLAHVTVDLPAGTLRIREARHRYTWTIAIGDGQGDTGFWVNAPQTEPKIG